MIQALDILVTRHGEKEAAKVVPGSAEDKLVHISVEGAEKLRQMGKRILPAGYNVIDVTTSDFVRTTETASYLLEGAGYNFAPQLATVRSDLGLSGVNWKDPSLPPFGNDRAVADPFIHTLLQDYYFPKGELLPVMARYAHATTDAVINGIERVMQDEGQGLVMEVIHGPIIDAFSAAVLGTVQVRDGKVVVERFPGSYAMGEFVKGSAVARVKTGNPTFLCTGREGEEGIKSLVSLDTLKEIRDLAYEHSQRKI